MSVRDETRAAMYDLLDTALPSVPARYENHEFLTPRDDPYLITWLRFSTTKKASIGTTQSFIRHTGFFMVDVVVPANSGSKQLWTLVDTITESFKERELTLPGGSKLTIEVPKSPANPRPQDGYYFVTVLIPFSINTKSGM